MSAPIKHWVDSMMTMKSRLQILVVLILFIGMTGDVSAEAEAPEFAAGTAWEYSVSSSLGSLIGQVEGGFEDLFIEGTVVMAVDSMHSVSVLGRTYDAWIISVEGDFDVEFTYNVPDLGPLTMTAPAGSEGYLYLDNESYEYVKSLMTITSRFTKFSMTFEFVIEIETSLDIEGDTWHFPFDVGASGTSTGHGLSSAYYVAKVNGDVMGENETSVPFSYTSDYECLDFKEVSVDAGSFQTYEVNASSAGPYLFGYPQGYRREYFSNEVNNSVEILVYDEGHELIGEWELLSYGEREGGSMDWTLCLSILVALVLLLVILGAIMLRRRSRERTLESESSSVTRVCRRCGVVIPEGESACPSCGRAIW
jgi:hypothetical protein